jgi:hypothetical protein
VAEHEVLEQLDQKLTHTQCASRYYHVRISVLTSQLDAL